MSEESSERDPLSVRQIKRKALNPPSEDVSVAKFSRKGILEYRASIIPIRQKSQEEIDKQVLTVRRLHWVLV
jgi:hypothetical protein